MELVEVFKNLQNKDTEYYIWGAYWRGEEVYNEYRNTINIVGFIDGDPAKESDILENKLTFSNLPIFTPKILECKNPENTKVIMAYHSSYVVKDTLENYGFFKNISWFEYKAFDLLYNYAINESLKTNHIFFSLKDNNISNRSIENNNFLPFDEVCKQVDAYFNIIDEVKFFGVLDEDWTSYDDFIEFLNYLHNQIYFDRIENFFIFADPNTKISDEYIELFSKYKIILRLSNYSKIGCNTEPLLALINRLDKLKVEYYLMFAQQEGKRKYVPGEKVPPYKPYSFSVNNYDYPNGEVKNPTLQHFFSTCDGDIRTILKNNKIYFQKTLDLCTYLPEIDFEEMDNFSLNQTVDKLEIIDFLVGNKNKKRPQRDLKLCFTGHGLGNQLFHYIFKRYIEEHTGETLIFDDILFLYRFEHNGSELRNILPNAKIQFLSDYFSLLIFKQIALIDKNSGVLISLLKKQEENMFTLSELSIFSYDINDDNGRIYESYKYHHEILNNKHLFMYYGGFWFNENWFLKQKSVDLLLKEFTFSLPSNEKQLNYINQIKSTESIAVHIRRGDALNREGFLVELDFYHKSIQIYRDYIKENYSTKPTFFVFSDDPYWCSDNSSQIGFTKNDNVIFIEGNNEYGDHYRDIQFMSLCQHMIVCHSTFSFFASLLNINKTYIKPFDVYDILKDTIDLEMLPNGIYK